MPRIFYLPRCSFSYAKIVILLLRSKFFEKKIVLKRHRVSVKVVIMVKVILVIFVSGMCFQCHYINIIKIIFYIVSRKESVKSFLTLMTNDLNDRVSLCSKWKVKSENWRVVVNKVIGHYGHLQFSNHPITSVGKLTMDLREKYCSIRQNVIPLQQIWVIPHFSHHLSPKVVLTYDWRRS